MGLLQVLGQAPASQRENQPQATFPEYHIEEPDHIGVRLRLDEELHLRKAVQVDGVINIILVGCGPHLRGWQMLSPTKSRPKCGLMKQRRAHTSQQRKSDPPPRRG